MVNNDEFEVMPNQVYGLEHGKNNRENALKFQQQQEETQNELGNLLGGSRSKRRTKRLISKKVKQSLRKRFFKYGGKPEAGAELVVPSFVSSGPEVSPINPTNLSRETNQALLKAKVDAIGDEVPNMKGGRKLTKRKVGGKKQPYAISSKRVNKSPFKNIATLKKTLKTYKSGKKIGYTQKSSLRSMGLIKRSNGKYQLSDKYKH